MTLEKVIWTALMADSELRALVGDMIFEDANDVPDEISAPVDGMVFFELQGTDHEESIDRDLYWIPKYVFICVTNDSEKKAQIALEVQRILRAVHGIYENLQVMESRSSDCRDEPIPESRLRIRAVYWAFTWRQLS